MISNQRGTTNLLQAYWKSAYTGFLRARTANRAITSMVYDSENQFSQNYWWHLFRTTNFVGGTRSAEHFWPSPINQRGSKFQQSNQEVSKIIVVIGKILSIFILLYFMERTDLRNQHPSWNCEWCHRHIKKLSTTKGFCGGHHDKNDITVIIAIRTILAGIADDVEWVLSTVLSAISKTCIKFLNISCFRLRRLQVQYDEIRCSYEKIFVMSSKTFFLLLLKIPAWLLWYRGMHFCVKHI